MNIIGVFIAILIVVVGTIALGKLFEVIFDIAFPKKKNFPTLVFSSISFVIILCLVVGAALALVIRLFSTDVLSAQPTDTEILYLPECRFIEETLEKSRLIQWIDKPLRSGYWIGVQVVTQTTLSLPSEWIMHDDPSNTDQLGPLTIPKNVLVSIYSPYKCRPLNRLD